MDIKNIFVEALARVEQEKQRQISLAKEKVIREKVIPYNAEVDKKKNKAIEELTNKFNADMNALRIAYEEEKKTLESLGEKNKADFQRDAIELEIATINSEATTAKVELEKMLGKLGG